MKLMNINELSGDNIMLVWFKNPVFYKLLLILYCITIFTLSSFPNSSYPEIDIRNIDKAVHAIIYLSFGILGGMYTLLSGFRQKQVIFFLFLQIAYAASDEIHQYFVPTRSCDFVDFLFDVVGILTGFATIRFIKYRLKIKGTSHAI